MCFPSFRNIYLENDQKRNRDTNRGVLTEQFMLNPFVFSCFSLGERGSLKNDITDNVVPFAYTVEK